MTPGVTAGIGALAAAAISATYRGINVAITFIAGHSVEGDVSPSLNRSALAHGAPVLVFYMALRQAALIQRCLLEAGRDPQEPAAVVACATTAAQQVLPCPGAVGKACP